MEASYIFRSQLPSINQYTKVFILTLSQMKAGWVDSTVPAPSLSTTTATAPSSKTMVSILMISTKTTMNDTMTAPDPTAKTITTIGYQDITVTVMAKTIVLVPS